MLDPLPVDLVEDIGGPFGSGDEILLTRSADDGPVAGDIDCEAEEIELLSTTGEQLCNLDLRVNAGRRSKQQDGARYNAGCECACSHSFSPL